MMTRMHKSPAGKADRTLRTLIVACALSLLAASTASAGGASGGVLGDKHGSAAQHQSRGQQNGSSTHNGGRGGLGGEV